MCIGRPGGHISGYGKITDRYMQSCSAVQAFKYSGGDAAKALWVAAGLHKLNKNNVGHGIAIMQKAPQIPNSGSAGHEPRVKSGMTSAQPSLKKGEAHV